MGAEDPDALRREGVAQPPLADEGVQGADRGLLPGHQVPAREVGPGPELDDGADPVKGGLHQLPVRQPRVGLPDAAGRAPAGDREVPAAERGGDGFADRLEERYRGGGAGEGGARGAVYEGDGYGANRQAEGRLQEDANGHPTA